MKRLEPEIIDYYNTEVLKMILEKYGMTPVEALRAFVCSETHKMLEEMEFFSYLLEYYADYKEKSTGDVLKEWDDHNVTQKIYDGYWEYHTERIENAFEDIDSLIATGKHAW